MQLEMLLGKSASMKACSPMYSIHAWNIHMNKGSHRETGVKMMKIKKILSHTNADLVVTVPQIGEYIPYQLVHMENKLKDTMKGFCEFYHF